MKSRSILSALGPDALRQIREQLGKEVVPHSVSSELDNASALATLSEQGSERSKFRNIKTPFRSIQGFELVAASKREAKDYAMLDLGIKTGIVLRWVPQVSFLLQGGSRYRCDALVFWADGRVTVRDCKGVETPAFKIKRGLMKSTYGLEIEIVK